MRVDRTRNLTNVDGPSLGHDQLLILLRWVLIIATSYLVVFSHPLGRNPAGAGAFVVVYFASNLLLSAVLPRFGSAHRLDATVIVFDTVMVSIGLALTKAVSSEFYVLYFVVLFVSGLTERLDLVVAAATLISIAHLYAESRFLGVGRLMTPAYALRVPFLFTVALFFGHLIQEAGERQRQVDEHLAHERRIKFLAGVTHDLRNPLGAIQLLATLLLDDRSGPLNEEQAGLVRRIHASTRHAITLAQNLLDGARIEAGRLVLQRSLVDIGDLIDDALCLAGNTAAVRSITLHSVVEPGLPAAEVDAMQMERVISNLIDNAIKFTPAGGAISVCTARDGGDIVLTVRDTGRGMSPDECAVAFQEYRRGARSDKTEGTGLGLFIVKAIVEAHGGTVALASTVGEGTSVTVRVPVAALEPPAAPIATVSAQGQLYSRLYSLV